MATVVESKQFRLNWRDAGRGLIVALIGAVLPILNNALYAWINGADFQVNWETVIKVAVGACLSYLSLNFGSASKVIAITDKGDLKQAKTRIEKVA